MVAHAINDERPLLLSNLPPSGGQRRLAVALIVAFLAVFFITLPFAYAPLPRIDAWFPFFATSLVLTDLLTAVLLFNQFSIVRQRSFLILAIGYLFSAVMVVPYVLTFPGFLAPTGLLGADLQSAVWLYVIWHIASPLSVIAYELFKEKDDTANTPRTPARAYIGASVGFVITVVCGLTWLVTAHHNLLPEFYADKTHLSSSVRIVGGIIFLLCAIALSLLWIRGRTVIDLWLMITVCAWLIEITLQGVLLTDRFSLAWYVGRTFSLIAGSIVLIVLLSEMTTLYAHLARSFMRQRAAHQGRQIAMDTMAASIAHELNQPLGAISFNADAALLNLSTTPFNREEVRAALEDIAAASIRGGKIIASLRAMFRKGPEGQVWFDANDLIHEVLAILDVDLRAQRVSLDTELQMGLPRVFADRNQLQQVFLNLIANAIESMRSVTDRERRLRITSDVVQDSNILVTIEDSGAGINPTDKDRIFEPFFTTKPSGTGIGLTICRLILDKHGGSLRASSNTPHGTIFEAIIPVQPEQAMGSSSLTGIEAP